MVTLQMTGRGSMYTCLLLFTDWFLNCVTACWLFKNKLESNLNWFLLYYREYMSVLT